MTLIEISHLRRDVLHATLHIAQRNAGYKVVPHVLLQAMRVAGTNEHGKIERTADAIIAVFTVSALGKSAQWGSNDTVAKDSK